MANAEKVRHRAKIEPVQLNFTTELRKQGNSLVVVVPAASARKHSLSPGVEVQARLRFTKVAVTKELSSLMTMFRQRAPSLKKIPDQQLVEYMLVLFISHQEKDAGKFPRDKDIMDYLQEHKAPQKQVGGIKEVYDIIMREWKT